MTRDNSTNGGNGQNPTASEPCGIVTTIIGPEATDTAHARAALTHEEQQGLALFATHGVADGASTIYAAAALGPATEANPIMAQLLQQGWGWAVGAMLLVTGLVAVVYPSIARLEAVPKWFGPGLAAVGLLIAILNVIVGVTA